MVSTDTPAQPATATFVVAAYPSGRNSAYAAPTMARRARRACSRRPLESYRRFSLTLAVFRSIIAVSVTDHCNRISEREMAMGGTQHHEGPEAIVGRLQRATNDHDLEAIVACFADGYRNE